ncbi:MAG TPA: ABC-2 family transporter protein [Fimbriimonadaceae bacterium]|nr:ABC-2 family transporter protein [Fimbriimonadaceae bacterium]HRJ32034.1 ABC-2 family transporter protein [Fimbriimonadaceae bacterium]
MRLFLRQFRAVLAIYIQDGFAYRASGFIWTLTDAMNAVVMPLVWASAAGSGNINGFTSRDFVQYYLCMLLITGWVTSHFMWEVANEIKDGQYSAYLVRPLDVFPFLLARNLAWRCVRTIIFLPLFAVILWAYSSMLAGATYYFGWHFWVALVFGHLVSVTFVLALANLALVFQEAQAIFELYYFPMLFLSGQLFPISLLPDWAQRLSYAFPFYFTTALPTEVLIGRVSPAESLPLIGGQLIWISVSVVAYRLLFRWGIRNYSAVGM